MPTEKRVRTRSHTVQLLWGAVLLLSGLFPQLGWAQATLENPQPDSFQSGIGVISGFVCTATLIEIEFDGTATFEAAYGTSRGDTASVCGDANNGFSLLFNWNLLDDGQHTVRALADGVEFANVTITVTTFGVEFLTGASGAFPLSGFPTSGTDITVRWQQPLQNFVITDGSAGSGGGSSGSGMHVLENPQPGSFQSGIGVISGFVCTATLIEIEFDGTATFEAAYGTSRGDTAGVCGDANNGFSLLFNWNLLGDGVHTVRALADGVEFASVAITVTTFGVEFLTGANGEFSLTDFPEAGTDVVIEWQQPLQNFVITQVITSPNDPVRQGELTLGTGNLRDANAAFLQAVAADPTDPQANLYSAITRIVTTILDDPELTSLASSSKATSNLLKSLASRSGVVITGDSRDVCAMSITLPEEVPSGAPRTGEIIETLRAVLLPEIETALESLNRISSTAVIRFDLMNLPECLRPMTERFEVEIDASDIQALRAALQLAQAAFEAAEAYDLDADLQLVTTQTSRAILDAEPTLLNLLSSASLTAARNLVEQALTNASMAIDSVFLETDDQSDDVLAILPEDTLDAERTRDTLDLVRQSLQGTVTLPTDIGFDEPQRLDLSLFFSGSFGTLRPFIPTFDNLGCIGTSVPATLTGELSSSDAGPLFFGRTGDAGARFPLGYFPDLTFGGTAPDLAQQDINGVLSGPKSPVADCYTFSGSSGQQISIRAQGMRPLETLFLVGPDGSVVESSDDCPTLSGICLPADLGTLSLPSTGIYTVEVAAKRGRSSDSYSYLLTISDQSICEEIDVPMSVNGTLDAGDLMFFESFVDCYTFTGNAERQISIQMQSGDFDTRLTLYGPDGRFLDSNNDCPGDGTNSCIPDDTLQGGRLSLPSTGTYTITASGATGNYSLTVSEGN